MELGHPLGFLADEPRGDFAHGKRQGHQGAGRCVEADGDHTEAGFAGLDGAVKTEEAVARGLLVVFERTVDSVLQREATVQHAGGIDRR